LRRLARNDALADDLAQNTFIKAYHKWDQLTDKAAVKAWLFRIAYREFLDHYRKEKRRRDLAPEPEIVSTAAQSGASIDIENAMNSLPEDCRAAVMMNLVYGYSHGQCAEILDMPLGTVKSHVARGKARLRDLLKSYESVK